MHCDFTDLQRTRACYWHWQSVRRLALFLPCLCHHSTTKENSTRTATGLPKYASRSVCYISHLGVVENVDGQPTIRKPKNARSKRALEARESKEVEDPRTVIFVRGTHTGEVVNGVMKDLVRIRLEQFHFWFLFSAGDMKMALKRPHAISFSKKNVVRPFEDATSLEFWAHKNDASMFVLGQSTKKRPNGLIIARMFDGRLLDMCELGVDRFVSMDEFKVRYHCISSSTLVEV